MISVDVVEFAEKFMNVELKDWQKEHLRILDKTRKDARICITMPRHLGRDQAVYIYMNAKELISSGKTNDRK